jgi:hypothetical protein
MAQFIKGNQLNAELDRIFEEAVSQLIIISPYIKLHSRIRDVLMGHKQNAKLCLTIVFGKNEEDPTKSLNALDFDFLKQFPFVEIKYEPRLHAKFYSNDFSSLLSSMNLYDYSQNNNIEFGILTKASLFGDLKSLLINDQLDFNAVDYFHQVIKNSKTLYRAVPQFENKMLGLSKKYTHSLVEVDELTGLFQNGLNGIQTLKQRELDRPKAPIHQQPVVNDPGYCIRTGEKIKFNIERPLSYAAFKEWNKYKDDLYPEKFCHYSGEPSNGQTSVKQPILKKNWAMAQKHIN